MEPQEIHLASSRRTIYDHKFALSWICIQQLQFQRSAPQVDCKSVVGPQLLGLPCWSFIFIHNQYQHQGHFGSFTKKNMPSILIGCGNDAPLPLPPQPLAQPANWLLNAWQWMANIKGCVLQALPWFPILWEKKQVFHPSIHPSIHPSAQSSLSLHRSPAMEKKAQILAEIFELN